MDIPPVNSIAQTGSATAVGSTTAPTRPAVPPPTTQPQAAQSPAPAAPPSRAQLDDAVKSINKALEALSQEVEFTVDEDTDRTVVKVIDQQTKQVIRQMPTEETLAISKALDKWQGLLIKQKA